MADPVHGGKALTCVVVTPERALLDQSADFVSLPMFDGELGVLPGRAALIGRLGCGELRIRHGGTTEHFYVDGGFAQIRDNRVTVLTARALKPDEISADKAREVLAEAGKIAPTVEAQESKLKAEARARAQLRVVGQTAK